MPLDRQQQALLRSIGHNLRRLRQEIPLSQEALAEKASLHTRTVQKIEAGEINVLITTLARLKEALHADWNELLGKE